MGYFLGVKRPDCEAGQKLYLLRSSRKSEDIINFSACFHGVETKYLNGRGRDCPTCKSLELCGFFEYVRMKLHAVSA
jgi:hypothetical protein